MLFYLIISKGGDFKMIGVIKHSKISNDRLVNIFNKVVGKSRVILESKAKKFKKKKRSRVAQKKYAIMAAKYRAERARKQHY
ncbi:MAG: hypothetical protein UV80_C0004G0017 [Candidatus Peregrinibacteria bacterium GW2011_GWF2_43_17]|nr:MAG: hypothetical protein UV80_C0004G0017 [Candidatus Peregrinibacteria bacterium GW2011_GWF2_43_17]